MDRRHFLQSATAVGVLGASEQLFPHWMPRLAFRDAQQAGAGDILVNIFLRGGIDGLSVVVPYSDGRHYYDMRPTQAIAEPGQGAETGIDLDGRFAFHPALSALKEIYDEGDLGIIHGTGLTDSTRSHFDAMRYMEYGTPGNKTIGTGWIGRHLESAAWQNESPFRAIGMGTMVQNSLRGSVSPLAIKSIADFHFKGRENELARLQQSLASLYTIQTPTNALSQQAGLVFDTIDQMQQIAVSRYIPAYGASYPDNEFGMALQQVAQLIKADVGLEVACVDLGGWDTHEYQGTLDGEFAYLLQMLAEGLTAFYTDMRDWMNQMTVVTMSEFGRTVVENASAGTDHGHGNVMFLMGGGVVGGQVMTNWPTLAPERLDEHGDLTITIDYRDVLAEVVSKRLRNEDLTAVFPHYQPNSLGIVRGL